MSALSDRPEGALQRAEPESFRGRELSVSLTVNDLRRSLDWYQDVLGFHVDREREEGGRLRSAVLLAGNVRIVLHQDDGAKGWDRKKGQGLSFRINTAQDVDGLAQGIVDRGGTLDAEPADAHSGARVFRVTDPDGFTFRIASLEED
jgi:uncharacterized glyoxalase superfamily protein PhnB